MNWEALAKWVNTRYGTNYSTNDLKKIPRSNIDEKIIERVYERLHAVDLSEGAPLLHEDYGLQMLTGWMKNKFNIEVPIEELRGKEPEEIRKKLTALAESAYRQKESEYPVLVGLTRFGRVVGNNQFQLDQESLANWLQRASMRLFPRLKRLATRSMMCAKCLYSTVSQAMKRRKRQQLKPKKKWLNFIAVAIPKRPSRKLGWQWRHRFTSRMV